MNGPDVSPDPPRERIPTPNYLVAVRPRGKRYYRIGLHAVCGITVKYAEPPATEYEDFVGGDRARRELQKDAVEYGLSFVEVENTPWAVENYWFGVGEVEK